MILYVCDNKKCSKVETDLSKMTKVTLNSGNNKKIFQLCDCCTKQLEEMFGTTIIKVTKKDSTIDYNENNKNENKEPVKSIKTDYKVKKQPEESCEKDINTHKNNEEQQLKNEKKNKRTTHTVREKIETYGVERIRKEYSNGEKTIEDLANELDIKLSTLKTFIYSSKILSDTNVEPKRGRPSKVKAQVKKVSAMKDVVNTVAKKDLSWLEKEVEVVTGTCRKCGYFDKLDGICGYSIVTGKTQNVTNGRCSHFIDIEELNNND